MSDRKTAERKVTLNIDDKQFKKKPDQREITGIRRRIGQKTITASITELEAAIEAGRTFMPGIASSASGEKGGVIEKDCTGQQIFGIDVDNSYEKAKLPKEKWLHPENVEAYLKLQGIPVLMMYHTFSNNADHLRFRVFIGCDEVITDAHEAAAIRKALVSAISANAGPGSSKAVDTSCTNGDRIFFGSYPGAVFYKSNKLATRADLLTFAALNTPEEQPTQDEIRSRPAASGKWTENEVREMLSFISAEDRFTWLRVGAALHHEGYPFAIFDEWSGTASTYGGTEALWRSLKDRSSNVCTMGTIVHLAGCGGWKPSPKRAAGLVDFPVNDDTGTEIATLSLKPDSSGDAPANTISNILEILKHAPITAAVRFDSLQRIPVILGDDGTRTVWTDRDDARTRKYIEDAFRMRCTRDKYEDAFNVLLSERVFDPLVSMMDNLPPWDGVERCGQFLTKWAKADDDPYTRECSRLLFAGGINRVYRPGCKFECVVTLLGAQAAGKSTLASWLAMDDTFFTSTKIIDGLRGLEAITGKFVVELEEMAFLSKTGADIVKAFISTQVDHYRRAYARRTEDEPRRCIFIGTSNANTFNEDQSGGRRWFPVSVRSTAAADLYPHEEEIKAYIRMCWAEMRDRFKNGDEFARPAEDYALIDTIRKKQAGILSPDEASTAIRDYITTRNATAVCNPELWVHAFGKPIEAYAPQKDGNQINRIMANTLGWVRAEKTTRTHEYSVQRMWLRPDIVESEATVSNADGDEPPF